MATGGQARAFEARPYAYGEARRIARELELAEPVAVTLVRRGHRSVEAARAFLEAGERHDPFLFGAMEEVCRRLLAAVREGRRVTIHGDYDVDGVSSTAILVSAIRELGGDCDWLIPDRMADGYGLSAATVAALTERGTELMVTVDCGISSAEEVALARESGIEVIVTDHHEPPEVLPDCPILHPRLDGYPFGELCAAGVAHKLSLALFERAGRDAGDRDLDLAALATVADMVPLVGENRRLVREGLAQMRTLPRPGLRALMAVSRTDATSLDAGGISFRLAPRINAAGRLYRADAGVELMLTEDPGRAAEIAAELDRANSERRGTEREVVTAAERERAALAPELAEGPALVIAGEGWHPGVVGIVASRLVERHWRPVVVIALDGDGGGRGVGALHSRVRPGRGAGALLGAPGPLRRPQHGRRAGDRGGQGRLLSRRPGRGGRRGDRAGLAGPDRGRGRDGRRRAGRAGARAGRATGGAGPVRGRQPRAAPAGALRPAEFGAPDGGGGQALALRPRERRGPRARRRLRCQRRPLPAGGSAAGRLGGPRGGPLERSRPAPGGAARALRDRARRAGRGQRRLWLSRLSRRRRAVVGAGGG